MAVGEAWHLRWRWRTSTRRLRIPASLALTFRPVPAARLVRSGADRVEPFKAWGLLSCSFMKQAAILCCSMLLWARSAAAEPWDKAGWVLTFHDEFDEGPLDTTAWRAGYRWGEIVMNEEMQAYVDDAFAYEGGLLRIVGTDEPRPYAGQTMPYRSGVITSLYAQRYGWFEIRCRMPAGRGLWPAFWLMPVGWDFWSGMKVNEIDIHEFLGHETDTMYMTVHWGDNYQDGHSSAGGVYSGPDFTSDFHTYAVDWNADRVVWLVDGVERFRYEGPGVPQVDMYVITNLAIGGSWPGPPDSTTVFPAYYDVDYIRIYERASEDTPEPGGSLLDASAGSEEAPDAADQADASARSDTASPVPAPPVEAGTTEPAAPPHTLWSENEAPDGCACKTPSGKPSGADPWALVGLVGTWSLAWARLRARWRGSRRSLSRLLQRSLP